MDKENKNQYVQQFDEHTQKIEKRYIDLYIEGFRPPVILERLTEEFGMSYHVLYKRINVKALKKIAESRAGMSRAERAEMNR